MRYLLLLLAALAIGCDSPPTFDGSSAEAAEASIKRMTEGMSHAEAEELGRAIAVFIAPAMLGGAQSSAEMYRDIDGLTAEEIIAKAQSAEPAAVIPAPGD